MAKNNGGRDSTGTLALLGVVGVGLWMLLRGNGSGGGIMGGSDFNPNTAPVEQTAPLGPSGDPQLQTISTGTMTAAGEETTRAERTDRRQEFAGATESADETIQSMSSEDTDDSNFPQDTVNEEVRDFQKTQSQEWSVSTSGGL